MSAYHLDAGFEPLFPFGFGLSYASFDYHGLTLSSQQIAVGDTLTVQVCITNHSDIAADEVVQLYVRDMVGSVTRPVRELKDFQRVHIGARETLTVTFALHTDALGFYGRRNHWNVEAGAFQLWVGGSSAATLGSGFQLIH